MYIVSACLAGFNTRYDGANRLDERVKKLVLEGRAIPLCPEQLAGLPTPRPRVEFDGGDGSALLDGRAWAVTVSGDDCSAVLIRGAEEVLSIAGLYGIKEAILKDGSPSCGITYVYSRGVKIPGMGVTAGMLSQNGIKVLTVDSL
jgi:uncharacterized protein YbbK (DUF523 family)